MRRAFLGGLLALGLGGAAGAATLPSQPVLSGGCCPGAVWTPDSWALLFLDGAPARPATTGLIEPFNKKGVALSETTTFAGDLEWDSLTVMDFVAAIEDEFDIIITMNMQAEIENVGQLADAVEKLKP